MVTNYIHVEKYNEVISKLRKSNDVKKVLELIIKFSFVLMKYKPAATLDIIKNHVKNYDPTKLVGSLLNVNFEFREVAIDFLEHCVY